MFYLHNGTYTVESKIFSTKLDELPFVYRLEKASYILFLFTQWYIYSKIKNNIEKLPFVYTSEKAS